MPVQPGPRAGVSNGPACLTDEFIERIPLDETRSYVKLILRNLMMYERLYKAPQSKTILDSP